MIFLLGIPCKLANCASAAIQHILVFICLFCRQFPVPDGGLIHGHALCPCPLWSMATATPGNGLDQIQIQLDFGIWILLDLNLVGYGHPFALDLIGLDFIE